MSCGLLHFDAEQSAVVVEVRTAQNTGSVITHADDSHGSKAFIRYCVSECLSVRTVERKRLKLQSPNLPQG